VRGRPVFVHHAVYSKAIPQYEVGFGRFRELMNNLEVNAPGLFLAGHYRDGISLSDSIVSGANAAVRIGNYVTDQDAGTQTGIPTAGPSTQLFPAPANA